MDLFAKGVVESLKLVLSLGFIVMVYGGLWVLLTFLAGN